MKWNIQLQRLIMKTKICTKCNCKKLLFEFHKNIGTKDRLTTICKLCIKIYSKNYYKKNKDTILNRNFNYYDKNKEQIAKYQKEYSIKYRKEHKKEKAILDKKYRDRNKNKLKKYFREYKSIRIKNDINFKLQNYLRTRIWSSLKGLNKSLSTMFLIGCEIDYLMYHIQEQFTKGMSWDNYGDWHIDHIKPCASFDLSKKSEQLKCFNYKNLQPLWALDNLQKHKNDFKN